MTEGPSGIDASRVSATPRYRLPIAAILLLDFAVLVHLGGGAGAAALFLLCCGFLLLPAVMLAMRAPVLRSMPADLRLVSAAALIVLLAVPWYFVRKAIGLPLVVDLATSILLTAAALRFVAPRRLLGELRPVLRPLAMPCLVVLPLIFSLIWLGFEVRLGTQVRYYGLLAIDFGNLASVISALRASPMLPLSFVAGTGALRYHWLYFTLPATLADFLGASMPSANALILMNPPVAGLLFHAVRTAVVWFDEGAHARSATAAASVALFAPFTTYFYQGIASHLPAWLALPTRNHLLLSPINSMVTFGNNSFALVLVLLALIQLERWNREGRRGDLAVAVIALCMIIGYSVTLVFSLAATVLGWTLLRPGRRPAIALLWFGLTGALAVALFLSIGILATGGSRQLAAGFDQGQFLKMVFLGIAPLWFLALIGSHLPRIGVFQLLILFSIAVPSFLYVTGGSGALIDFSMKTGSLIAVALAPLIAPGIERVLQAPRLRWRTIAGGLLMAMGLVQTSVYVLQFSWYRMARPDARGWSVPADYHDALIWIRDHTPPASVVVDGEGASVGEVLAPMMIGERRVWLPTLYTEQSLIVESPSTVRRDVWMAFLAGDQAASRQLASEADYLLVPGAVHAGPWREVRHGTWNILQSTVRAHR